MSDHTDDVIRETINSSPLFEHLPDKFRESLTTRADFQAYPPGEVVVEEGEPEQNHLYLIASGEARVWTRSPRGTVELQTLGPGEYFGEVSILSQKVATATVEAFESTLRVVALDQKTVLEIVERDDKLRNTLEGVTLERAKDTIGKVME